ncbi:DarT ssDNA thymidine ADP-ribosyltransferase family protein [Pedobacter sp. Leaf250]|uniref:DarT ssDNA thymidine ADP-ribosyltransferase family protein n=1 Tax=Pedobacter sp. Leaf250 TaxID=2876559 RepID=UPI001E3E361B|nr:DarT ssDNA thymidine ADP-ribosyltransferase family protein [Pedobacter sp. Leaf250]
MGSTKTTYASFPFEWYVKATSYQIRYRKAFNINQIDEIFCSIINAKGNEINFSELGILLGFNLQDLAERDILNIYLKDLTEYNLITINQEIIHLTDFGQEALQSKLKYKYYFATAEVFENQTANGENFDFSFKSVFDLENRLSHERETTKKTFDDLELKQKIQFQLFENDIYLGEIVDLIENPKFNHKTQVIDVVVNGSEINYKTEVVKVIENHLDISYKPITLQCDINIFDNVLKFSFYKSGIDKPQIETLINLPENEKLKSELIRKAMYHHILSDKSSINAQDIETYIDLWNWKELAESQKVDWSDKTVFELFHKYGDGSIWSAISLNAPIEKIKLVIQRYAEYWNWTILTERFDDKFIKENIEHYDWDFEELSQKESELVTSILFNLELKHRDWDWNYLSKNLPDNFIEEHIEDFSWDFYVITVSKNEIFKNTFIKYRDRLEILISKEWNWKFISEEINLNFLYKNISGLASKLDWHIVLNRFFNNKEITAHCLKDESFKAHLKKYLPDNFVIAHQKYLWTLDLIDFFEEQNLIQWETKIYIQGFDTNDNFEWNKLIFEKYNRRITSDKGFLNVSQHISDYHLIEEFPDFAWNWLGMSKNKNLIDNTTFIEGAFVGNFSFSGNLVWNEILSNSTFDISFWNKNLEAFHDTLDNEKQIEFWKSLTRKEQQDYIIANNHFPWDWTFITENIDEDAIIDSFDDDVLFEKWDWKIASRKLDKETILDNLEDFARFIDWKFLIKEVFSVENELVMDKQLPRIAACLSIVQPEIRKDIWRDITAKIPFELLFPIVETTNDFQVFEWDWDFIANNKYFPTDISTLNKFRQKINWSILSESNAIQKKFNPSNWNNGKEWFNNIDHYLKKFIDNWDWQILTQNRNINYNRLLLQKYKDENWDWEYLTEFGGFLTRQKKDNEKYLEQVAKQFPKINFETLSKRLDINIDSNFILSTKDRNWDWQSLSANEKADISNELILELKDKNWYWKAISKRKKIDITNVMLLQLLEKDWDWAHLSENLNLEFDFGFIEKTKEKNWNWKTVSRHKTFLPTIEILTLTKDFDLDWAHLSQHSSLDPTKELLAKFENKWHWKSITKNTKINFDDIDFIERFADKWNWHFICESSKLTLNNQILNQFKKYLDWNLISSNTNMDFTKKSIQDFKQFWNWTSLKQNKRIEELLGNYIEDEIENSPILNFVDRIDKQYSHWKGSIYHFAHIDNAVEIIKTRKIQSRNTAARKSDAAGNVVHRRDDAHDYARFYFRPNTPTQFYNEFLGKNTTDKFFDKARNLGFPKCPLPIFFRFSLKEVLYKNESKCCVSNGNMQKGATKFKAVEQMIDKFNFQYLYSVIGDGLENYMNYSQQEFLVKDELSFKDEELNDFEIVCPTEADRRLLVNLLGNEHKDIFSKIVVDRRYYNNENPRVRIEEEDSELHISTNFSGEGYFVLNGTSDIEKIEILFGDVTKTTQDKIIFKSNISLGNVKQNLQLNFIDESNRNWFVYAN